MTVTVESSVAGPFIPNGATTVFSFDFKIMTLNEILVYHVVAGVPVLISSSAYTVAIAEDLEGGTVTFSVAPATSSGDIFIVGDPRFVQLASFSNSGFLPTTLNPVLDRIAVRLLALKRASDSALKMPLGEAGGTLPVAAARAGKILSFNGAGAPEAITSVAAVFQAVEDAESAAATAAADAAALVAATLIAAVDADADRAEAGATLALLYAAQASALAAGGYFYDPVTYTRYKYAMIEGTVQAVIYPHIFIDPENGNDAWDGTCGYRKGATTQGPVRTRARVEALPAFASSSGCTIAIHARDDGTPWRDGFDYYDPNLRNTGIGRKHHVSFVVYGGSVRKVSCLDIINKGSITAHPTISGAYRITVAHDMHTGGVSSLRIFQDGEPLVRKSTDAAVSAEGTFYYAGTIAEGVSVVVDFHPWGGGNPISDSHVYEVTMRDYAFGAGDGCYVEGIWGYANGSNNGSISLYNDAHVRRCIAEQGTKHNWVIGADCDLRDLITVNCQDGNNYTTDALGNLGVVFSSSGAGKSASLTRCGFFTDGSIYAHSDGGASIAQPLYEHMTDGGLGTMRLTSCWFKNYSGGAASESAAVYLTDHMDYGASAANQGAWGGDLDIHIERGLFLNPQRFTSTSKLTMHNAIVIGTFVVNQYYGTQPVRMDVQDNILAGTNVIVDNIAQAGANLTFAGNIFTVCYSGYHLTGAPNSATTYSFHRNRYEYGTPAIPPDGNSSLATLNGTEISTFVAWKALGYDLDSQVSVIGDMSAWLSGARPTLSNVNVQLAPGGPAYNLPLSRVDQARVAEYLARPTTYAAGLDYVKNTVPRTPVWDGMT